MQSKLKIGIIGDFNAHNLTHSATNAAIAHAAARLAIDAVVAWLPTPQIEQIGSHCLHSFQALWCSPGSPYQSMKGALAAIRFARESNLPFFAT